MRPNLKFRQGPGGGIQMESVSDTTAEESFYVADDEKSITLVDILAEIKDKRLSLQMFMSLLKDLSEIMSVQAEDRKGDSKRK